MDDLFGITGKKALVIGGGLGMGRASARLLAQAGADVALVDLDADRAEDVAAELTKDGHKAVALAADVTNRAEAERAVAQADQALGGLDLLMNMVGRNTYVSLFDMTDEQFERTLSVNLRHHFYISVAFAR